MWDKLFIPLRAWLLLVALAGLFSCGPTSPPLAPGVFHHQLALTQGPWAIHIIEIDLPEAWEAGIRLRTARADLAHGILEKTSVLAGDAIAAINGDFFYRDEPVLRTAGLQIRDGQILQFPQRRSAFVVTVDGQPLIDVFRFEAGLITPRSQILPISALNRRPAANGLSFYTQFGQGYLDSSRAQIGFQLQKLELRSPANDTIAARIVQVCPVNGELELQEEEWLVTAGVNYLQDTAIAPGDTVQVYWLLPPAVDRLQEGIGGGPRLIRDGEISIEYEQEGLARNFALDRHPRTAIGYSEDAETLFLVTVDGRQPGFSEGMTLEELADFMLNKLAEYTHSGDNAYQALNLDGGGSTTMIVRQQVVNRPSDETGERPVANALLVVDSSSQSSPSL